MANITFIRDTCRFSAYSNMPYSYCKDMLWVTENAYSRGKNTEIVVKSQKIEFGIYKLM